MLGTGDDHDPASRRSEEMQTRSPSMDMKILDDLVARLRAADGCPWDREQTLTHLRAYLLEEAHELAAAIDDDDWNGLREEMGDLLFQLAFIGRLNEEAGRSGLAQSIDCVHEKMVDRHPHVFGDETASDSRQVAQDWERRKLERREVGTSLLKAVNPSLPSLVTSYRMTQKAAGIGFDWKSADEVVAKVREELNEVEGAREESADRRLDEIGDLLFAVANLARHLDVDPEAALARSNLKFRKRFRFIERSLGKSNRRLSDASLEELDQLWEEAKAEERETSRGN